MNQIKTLSRFAILALLTACAAPPPTAESNATPPPANAPVTRPASPRAVESVPSEDSQVRDFHSLGLIDGRVDIFRCASPVHDIHTAAQANAVYQHLYDLGIRTVVSLEDPSRMAVLSPDPATTRHRQDAFKLEKAAAARVGVAFVNHPMNNEGPHSLETMSDAQVRQWLEMVTDDIVQRSATGGVIFHCSAGHDRTGIVAAYIRIKYQHWPVDQAIAEMRRDGHNWKKFSSDGGVSSWHEDHLRAIAASNDLAGAH